MNLCEIKEDRCINNLENKKVEKTKWKWLGAMKKIQKMCDAGNGCDEWRKVR